MPYTLAHARRFGVTENLQPVQRFERFTKLATTSPIKRTVADAFERMQEAQGDHLTGPEVSRGVFGHGAHLLIDLIEQCSDKIQGGHGLLHARQGFALLKSLEERNTHYNKTNKYY